jgi:predicted small secreted protein
MKNVQRRLRRANVVYLVCLGILVLALVAMVAVILSGCTTERGGYGTIQTRGQSGYTPYYSNYKLHKHGCKQQNGW